MSRKLTAIAVLALIGLLAVTSVNALPRFRLHSYPAEIQLDGEMTLKDITDNTNTDTDVDIETNFTALVPFYIEPDAYTAYFLGRALVSGESIKFKGLILIPSLTIPAIRKGNFWVNFREDRPEDLADGTYVALGEDLSINITAITPENKVIWVHMKGIVNSYNDSVAHGGIVANAKINESARVHGFFTQHTPEEETSKNYTFTFFAFRLANATTVELNYDDHDLYISGRWNVYNITITHYDHDWSLTVKQFIQQDEGELTVDLESPVETGAAPESEIPVSNSLAAAGTFTLDISSIEPIEGDVIFYHLRYCLPIRSPTPIMDHNGDWKVDMIDIADVARRYGARFGKPAYNFFLDVNFDYVINILDLASVAQNFGQEY